MIYRIGVDWRPDGVPVLTLSSDPFGEHTVVWSTVLNEVDVAATQMDAWIKASIPEALVEDWSLETIYIHLGDYDPQTGEAHP